MSRAELIDAEGRMLQRWQHPETSEWYNVTRLDSGGLFVIAAAHDLGPDEQQHIRDKAEGRTLLRYDEAGRLLWERRLPVHHDIQPTSDGTFVTLTSRFRAIASVHPTAVIEDNGLAILSAGGEILDELSLFDLLSAEGAPFEWIPKKAEERADGEWVDLLHANSVFPIESSELAARHEIFGPDKLLVSIRHQNVIVVIDLAKRALVWSWGQGELSGPHDATALDNGHLLVFDNGLGRGWSRVAEVDPISGQIIWEYAADPREDFYTTTRGSCERLPNGNTLIAESDRGRAFEVTRDGEIVWSYAVPYLGRNGKRMSLTRIRRFN